MTYITPPEQNEALMFPPTYLYPITHHDTGTEGVTEHADHDATPCHPVA